MEYDDDNSRRGPQNDNRSENGRSGASARTKSPTALYELAGSLRDVARDLARRADALFSPGILDGENDRVPFEELLREGVTAALEPYLEAWRAQMDEQTAHTIADLLAYHAVALLGRRIAERERGGGTDDGDERSHAADFLSRLLTFASLFGAPRSWHGRAARRFALERLAGPLGFVEEDASGSLQIVSAELSGSLAKWIARSWRDVVGLLLGLTVSPPATPHPQGDVWHTLDYTLLARALERAVSNDGLIWSHDRTVDAVTQCLMTQHSAWMLVHERADAHAGSRLRIDQARLAEVIAILDHVETLPIDQWRPAALTCPPPRCAVRLPAGAANIALACVHTDGAERARLLITAELPAGWTTWLLSATSAASGPADAPLQLTSEPTDGRPEVSMARFPARSILVQGGETPEPFFVLPGPPAHLVRLAARDGDNGRARTSGSRVVHPVPVSVLAPHGREAMDAAYSLSDDEGHEGRYLLLVGPDALTLYRAAGGDTAWWSGRPLEPVGHTSLVTNVTVFGVMDDLIIFSIADGFWSFFPVQAALDQVPPCFALMRREARGVLFRSQEDSDWHEILPPPSWVRHGQLDAIDYRARDGSLAVTFADSGRTSLYARGRDSVPVMLGSVESRRSLHAHVAHRRLDDGRYLLMRTHADRIEYCHLSPEQRARDELFSTCG